MWPDLQELSNAHRHRQHAQYLRPPPIRCPLAAGHLGSKTGGPVLAEAIGTLSTPEESALPVSTSGLKRSASLAADGRRIPIGTPPDPTLIEAIAEVHSRYRSLYGGRCR